MKFLSRMFAGRSAAPAPFTAPLAPEERLAVIGDIHGTDALLALLLDKVAAHQPDRRVFVGDFIDRGEESAQVLGRLHAIAQMDPRAVFLKGNHEAMMLAFLDDPAQHAKRWMRYGGLQTLASFRIGQMSPNPTEAQALAARDALARALGPDLLAWLRGLPTRFVSGNVAVVHAGADPARGIDEQDEQVLVWGHPDFTARPRSDGVWVVHGHTIAAQVSPEAGRIGVDTGAYATGRLSAALIGPERLEVVSASWRDLRAAEVR